MLEKKNKKTLDFILEILSHYFVSLRCHMIVISLDYFIEDTHYSQNHELC